MTNKRTLIFLAAAMVVVALAIVTSIVRSRPNAGETQSRSGGSTEEAPALGFSGAGSGGAAGSARTKIIHSSTRRAVPEAHAKPPTIYHVRAGQVLAIVNGVAITLKDLVPLGKDDANADHSMTDEEYEARLNRAIDRELTFQAANGQHIELTEAQQKQLEELRAQYKARLEDPAILWSTITQAQIDFQARDVTARLLQDDLLGLNLGLSPHVTSEQVDQYYQSHIQQYGVLPTDPVQRDAAWQKIDYQIREELAPITLREYQMQRQAYLDQLRNAAGITRNPPPS